MSPSTPVVMAEACVANNCVVVANLETVMELRKSSRAAGEQTRIAAGAEWRTHPSAFHNLCSEKEA